MCVCSFSLRKGTLKSLSGCNAKASDQDYHSVSQHFLSLLLHLLAGGVLFVDIPTNFRMLKTHFLPDYEEANPGKHLKMALEPLFSPGW